jgi:hypothetical protein
MQNLRSQLLGAGNTTLGRAAIAFAVTTTTPGMVQLRPNVRAQTKATAFQIDAVVAPPDPLPANLSQRTLDDLYRDAERIFASNTPNLDLRLQPVLLEIERREGAAAAAFRASRAADFVARRDEADAIIAGLDELLRQV